NIEIVKMSLKKIAIKHTVNDNKIIIINGNIGNIIPSHATMLQNWKLESDPIQSYNIFFTARNGSFTQLLRFKKINGLWLSATKVTNKDNVILYERIDDNYPREISGNISWE
ncbi:MAG: hypothetical protein IE890_09050, partial [Arcobacter sp.]|nr:hypothetical protein [Arcobacter sp.]